MFFKSWLAKCFSCSSFKFPPQISVMERCASWVRDFHNFMTYILLQTWVYSKHFPVDVDLVTPRMHQSWKKRWEYFTRYNCIVRSVFLPHLGTQCFDWSVFLPHHGAKCFDWSVFLPHLGTQCFDRSVFLPYLASTDVLKKNCFNVCCPSFCVSVVHYWF